MTPSFLEMGFSVQGIHPKNSDGIYTNREGFLFRKVGNNFKPIKPHIGNRFSTGNRGAYFYFDFEKETYKVYQDEIEEFGLNAPAHKMGKK